MNLKMNLNLKKLPKIPRKYKLLLMAGATVVMVVALYFLVLSPQMEERDRYKAELAREKQELARLLTIKAALPKKKAEYAQLQERLKDLVKQMPEQKDIPNLLRNVSAIAQETKLRIKYFEPKDMQVQEFYSELPFEIRYTGPYHTIGYFFDGVRRLDRIINITTFAFEARPNMTRGALEGVCLARTYVYLKEPVVKEKGKAKKDAKKEGKDEGPPKK